MTLAISGIKCCVQKRDPATPRNVGIESEPIEDPIDGDKEACEECGDPTLHVASIERDYKHMLVLDNQSSILSYLVYTSKSHAKKTHVSLGKANGIT